MSARLSSSNHTSDSCQLGAGPIFARWHFPDTQRVRWKFKTVALASWSAVGRLCATPLSTSLGVRNFALLARGDRRATDFRGFLRVQSGVAQSLPTALQDAVATHHNIGLLRLKPSNYRRAKISHAVGCRADFCNAAISSCSHHQSMF